MMREHGTGTASSRDSDSGQSIYTDNRIAEIARAKSQILEVMEV